MYIKIFHLRYWYKYFVWYLAVGLIILGIAARPQNAVESAKLALSLCGQVIIPSLLPFFVASSLLVSLGFARVVGSIINPVMRPVFGVSGRAGIGFVLGIISGYPVGAQVAAELYKNGDCSKNEAERLLAFCNNSGPLFVIGAVGVGMFQSPYVGYLLYLSHILSAILVGMLFGIFRKSKQEIANNKYSPISDIRRDIRQIHSKAESMGELIAKAVKNAALSMVNICGFVIFFTVIGRMLYDYGIFNNIASVFTKDEVSKKLFADVLRGMVEMTAPLHDIIASDGIGLDVKMALASFIIGFAGVSVHFQTMGVVAGTGMRLKSYLTGKVAQGMIAALLSFVIVKYIPNAKPAFLQLDSKVESAVLGMFWNNFPNSLIFLSDAVIIMLIIMVAAYVCGFILKKMKNNNI